MINNLNKMKKKISKKLNWVANIPFGERRADRY